MEENFIGYLLNSLDADTHRQVEEHLHCQPEATRQLELLRRALQPLELDRTPHEPPVNLASRTLARIQQQQRATPPPAAPPILRAYGAVTWWRRPDVLVAAALVLFAVGIGFPGLYQLRMHYANRQDCANNLRNVYQSLVNYSDFHNGEFPMVEERPRHNVAGAFVPLLQDAGVLNPEVSFRCPGNGNSAFTQHTMKELEAMSPEEFERVAPRLSSCYAYTLGYRDAAGQLHGLRRDDEERLPLLADRPQVDPAASNAARASSPNHKGQNVLFLGGQVRFFREPTAGKDGDHIYLNRNGRVGAGVDRDDTVLGLSADQP
jgi:hypothetical protein